MGGAEAASINTMRLRVPLINSRASSASGLSISRHLEDKLDPNWVTGFVDAEGCFSVMIEISKDLKRKVKVSFEINLHEKDKDILYKIQSFFGVGAVYNRQDKPISWYRVTKIAYINNVIITSEARFVFEPLSGFTHKTHFSKYPLISKKTGDFLLWSKVVEIISNKGHLSEEGFFKYPFLLCKH